ncbi:preprotein translocase subunit YajC [uncultured Parasutterella sp.]|uniref:preprotein translocase subunit YajC n=1 Tax=uncultured Parasutterella sp. TaxID=1263098 RepID=UPI0025991198|nr:preprotein translocase subunit YajC [uncultured Parasutterella sp.]
MFISEAYAQATGGAVAAPGGLESMASSFGIMILIFAVFWFLLIRPQQKRQKEHKKMIDALTVGDEVITAGGICGKILAADENYINLQIAQVEDKPVAITFQRLAIQAVLPKGTVKF